MSPGQKDAVLFESDDSDSDSEEMKRCYLLEIAPELRNRIYEYALVNNSRIPIDKTLRPPPLLHTCKQIKGEATKMWLRQNRFGVHIRRYDASHLIAFYEVLDEASSGLPSAKAGLKISYTFSIRPHWANLKNWCENVYYGVLSYPSHSSNDEEEATIAIAALNIAGKEPEPEWEYCEEALEQLRKVAGQLDSDWLKDYPTTQDGGRSGSA